MNRVLLLATLFFVLLVPNVSKATHIVGGEIYYDSLGNNQYRITIEIFRDCSPTSSGFDTPLEYTIFYQNGTIWSTFQVTANLIEQLPIIYDDPCVTPPSDICIERAIYIDTVTLPFDVDGYYISYQRCCWSNGIDNIVDPVNNGITLTTSVPGSSLVDLENQGARFINYPPLVLCAGNTLDFDHAAFDPDGDSLVYSLAAPFEGGSSATSMPNPETAAPYNPVTWNPGFSETVPFGPGSTITVDDQTGMISFTPNLIGNYVAGVRVDEYREGILINTHVRTYGYRVVSCLVIDPPQVDLTGPTMLIEDCGQAGFIVSRTDSTAALTVQVLLSGTATNGDDYPFIPDTLIIPANVGSDTIAISAYYDSITEGNETVNFSVIIENICDGTYDTTSISLTIVDYLPMTITSTDSVNICTEMGETVTIGCLVSGGVAPYGYYWQPGSWSSNDSIFITGAVLEPNLNQFVVLAQDVCGKQIYSQVIDVYDQCPLIAPNVITMNGDGINDAFIVKNLEDFDRIAVQIVDRWGVLVYENEDYKNDWKGIDVSGKELTEGVYFYTVTPKSEKFIYDDVQRTEYTLHGFIHLYNK